MKLNKTVAFYLLLAAASVPALLYSKGLTLAEFPGYLYKLFTPEPVSPLFKSGGYIETQFGLSLNEDATFLTLCLVVCGLLDFLIITPLVRLPDPKRTAQCRWFALHCVANFLGTVATWPDVMRVLFEVERLADGSFAGTPTCSMLGPAIAVSCHLYHCIPGIGFHLSADDIFHHFSFVFSFHACAIPAKWATGPFSTYPVATLTGISGGTSYGLLVLKEHGLVAKLTERKISTFINVWLRAPSQTIYAYALMKTVMHRPENPNNVPLLICLGGLIIFWMNGQYYSREVQESLARHLERERVHKAVLKDKQQHDEEKKKQQQQQQQTTTMTATTTKGNKPVAVSPLAPFDSSVDPSMLSPMDSDAMMSPSFAHMKELGVFGDDDKDFVLDSKSKKKNKKQ